MDKADKKTYFHRVPGAKFYMPDGRAVNFSAGDGSFTADQRDIQFELDKIADVPTSYVYTENVVVEPGEKAVAKDIREGATAAFNDATKTPTNVETVEIPVAKQPKPNIPGSGEAAVVSGDKLAAAKAAIAASGNSAASNSK